MNGYGDNIEPTLCKKGGFFYEGIKMPIITIDNKEYDIETLSNEAKTHLASMQFVDSELARLQANVAVLQTARIAYSKALIESLPKFDGGDTIKL